MQIKIITVGILSLLVAILFNVKTLNAQTVTNLILNPSVETANGTKPDKWYTGKWGTNTATFSYSNTGYGSPKSVKVDMTAYTSGDAKWYHEDVKVTPGSRYTFSEYYKTNTTKNLVVVRWKKTDGAFSYQSFGNPSVSATGWMLRTSTFTVPANVTSMTVFHVINGIGSLEIDSYKLILVTTAPTVSIDATVTAWSNWLPTSAWGVCLNSTQTRAEQRTRTVLTSAVNGGVKPSLIETRTTTQVCVGGQPVATSTIPALSTTTQYNPSSAGSLNFTQKGWGAYVGWAENDLTSFENMVGKSAKYRAVFIHWGNEKNFPTYLKPEVGDKGKDLIVFWEATNYNVGTVNQTAYSYDSIINGNFDSYFTQFAKDAKAYEDEVILIPFSEMNGDWFPWSITKNGNNAQKHIDAWRKIKGFFNEATNVKFGWAPNQVSVPDIAINQFENFYPGDAYVDYVGLDGFNFGTPWLSFDQLFAKPLAKMKVYKKPVYIFSFASAGGTQKASWITDALTVQMAKYPEIKGWIWFNENKERDWTVNSDVSSLNAFKQALP